MPKFPPSETAKRLFKELKKLRIAPIFEMPIFGTEFTADLGFPDVKYYVEVNGPHHRTEEQASRDYRRDSILSERGWTKRAFTEKNIDRDVFACAKIIEADYLKLKNQVKTEASKPIAKRSPVWWIIAGIALILLFSLATQNARTENNTETPSIENLPQQANDATANTYSAQGVVESLLERKAKNGATFWIASVSKKEYYIWDASISTLIKTGKNYQFTVKEGEFPRIINATIIEEATIPA